ncbi:hypothetical protein D918_03802 [Trichuris suis]|nr:hypothetical protein D918_03802 [Trichuris suis]
MEPELRVHGWAYVKFTCQVCNHSGTTSSPPVHMDSRETAQSTPEEGSPAHGAVSCSAEGCGRAFNMFRGLRLHMKRAHPATFEATKKPIVNQRWEKGEKMLLAELEIKLSRGVSEKKLCEMIAGELRAAGAKDRSVGSIRAQLRKREQRTLVANMRAEEGRL